MGTDVEGKALDGLSTVTRVDLGAKVLFGENDAMSELGLVSLCPNENCIVCFCLSPIKSVSFNFD